MPMFDPYVVATIAGQEERFRIERLAVCRIGRSAHATIVLRDALCSREHAMIRRDASGHCYLSDSGSRNGTTLNGRPVTSPTRLSHADVIRIGFQEMRFHQPQQAALLEAREEAKDAPVTMIHFASSLISVLVIDIRGYTRLARDLGEERTSALMSELFREAGELLFRNRSWSQKYIGDAVMGVWVHPQPQVTSEELATMIDTVAGLRRIVEGVAQRFGLPDPLGFGAALNTGQAQIGNMGSAAIADFTALGDTVNKAFRLEAATRDEQCDLLIGKAVLDLLVPPLEAEQLPPLADVAIRGYDQPEPAFRLMFGDLPRLGTLVTTAHASATMPHADPRS